MTNETEIYLNLRYNDCSLVNQVVLTICLHGCISSLPATLISSPALTWMLSMPLSATAIRTLISDSACLFTNMPIRVGKLSNSSSCLICKMSNLSAPLMKLISLWHLSWQSSVLNYRILVGAPQQKNRFRQNTGSVHKCMKKTNHFQCSDLFPLNGDY